MKTSSRRFNEAMSGDAPASLEISTQGDVALLTYNPSGEDPQHLKVPVSQCVVGYGTQGAQQFDGFIRVYTTAGGTKTLEFYALPEQPGDEPELKFTWNLSGGGGGGSAYTSPNETITVDNDNGTLEATRYAMRTETTVTEHFDDHLSGVVLRDVFGGTIEDRVGYTLHSNLDLWIGIRSDEQLPEGRSIKLTYKNDSQTIKEVIIGNADFNKPVQTDGYTRNFYHLSLEGATVVWFEGIGDTFDTPQLYGAVYERRVTTETVSTKEPLAWEDQLPTIDSALSSTSTNPVQNKAVYNELTSKINVAWKDFGRMIDMTASQRQAAYAEILELATQSFNGGSKVLPCIRSGEGCIQFLHDGGALGEPLCFAGIFGWADPNHIIIQTTFLYSDGSYAENSEYVHHKADKPVHFTSGHLASLDSNGDLADSGYVPSDFATSDAVNGKAPISHASTATTYGEGDATHYGHVKVDSALSASSTNPVQNKAVYSEFTWKINRVTGAAEGNLPAFTANGSLADSGKKPGDFASSDSVPSASTATPQMDGAASAGSGTSYARSDHVHPTDTSRQAALPTTGTATNTYAINVSGNAGTATKHEVSSVFCSTQHSKWYKIATFTQTNANTNSSVGATISVIQGDLAFKSAGGKTEFGVYNFIERRSGTDTQWSYYNKRNDYVAIGALTGISFGIVPSIVNSKLSIDVYVKCNDADYNNFTFTVLNSYGFGNDSQEKTVDVTLYNPASTDGVTTVSGLLTASSRALYPAEMVSALPASPEDGVMYLIPET